MTNAGDHLSVFDRASVRAAIDRLGIRPRRGLGQHFLADPALLAWMADQAQLQPHELVVEIGPGMGQWTTQLARRARQVIAFELDPILASEAQRNLAPMHNVIVAVRDGTEWTEAVAPCPGPLVVVSNLPYAVYRDLLIACLSTPLAVRAFFFTIQREVFEKLTAPPGDPRYTALGAVLTSFCSFARLGPIPCTAFVPEPQVESVFFRVERQQPPPEPFRTILRQAEALFCWKKKRAKRAVASHLGEAARRAASDRFGARMEERLRQWPPPDIVALADWCARWRSAS